MVGLQTVSVFQTFKKEFVNITSTNRVALLGLLHSQKYLTIPLFSTTKEVWKTDTVCRFEMHMPQTKRSRRPTPFVNSNTVNHKIQTDIVPQKEFQICLKNQDILREKNAFYGVPLDSKYI